jgi:hypothetical protein
MPGLSGRDPRVTRTDSAAVVELFRSTMHLPDPSPIYAVLGAIAGNRLPGDPLWLLMVGPPSSGKTEALDALRDLPECHTVSTFSVAGLLSGSPSKDPDATGGLLRQIGERGVMVAPDFGTLLNEHGSTRGLVFASLREIFDGRLIRRLGGNGGQTHAWEGHCGFVGAVTEAIDAPSVDLGLLGERFTYFRMPPATPEDEFAACVAVEDNAGRSRDIRSERAAAVQRLFDSLGAPRNQLPALSDDDTAWLITLATVGARCRSSVLRDGHAREIELVPAPERPPRLYGQLRQLHAGLDVIGTPPDIVRSVLTKAALDGMHPGRRRIIEFLVGTEGAHATATIGTRCRLPVTPTRRHLQDLTAHSVIELVGDSPERWSASGWLRERWWAAEVEDPRPG